MRYIRLYLYFVRFAVSRAMEFRFDFWFRMIMDIVYYAMNIIFFKVLFLHTATLGGWNAEQGLIFICAWFVVDATQMTFLAGNTWYIGRAVNTGTLDYYLVRPVRSLFLLGCRDIAAASFVNLLVAIGLLCWAVSNYSGPVSIGTAITFGFLLINGTLVFAMMRFLFMLPVFWTHSGRGLELLFFQLDTLAQRPDAIFRGAVRRVITTVLPFAMMASFPSRFLFANGDWEIVVHIAVVTVGMALFTLWVWGKALRAYSSASS